MKKSNFSMQAPLIIDISVKQLLLSIASRGSSQNTPSTIELNSGAVADIHHSVRSAWDVMLQATQPIPGAEVILSGINIKHMRDIVIAHGLKPVYAEVNFDTLLPSLAEIQSKKTDRTVGVLCAHLFGTWSPLDELANWCRSQKIFLAEDCAQAFMGSDFEGTHGATTTFFSFGTIKRSTALGGALAIVRNQELRKSMGELSREYPVQSEIQYKKKLVKSLAIVSVSQPHTYAAAIKILQARYGSHEEALRNAVRGFPTGTVPQVFRVKPCASLRAAIIQRFHETKKQTWLTRGQQVFDSFAKAGLNRDIILGCNANNHTFWLVPIRSHHPEKTMNTARDHGLDATRGVTSMLALSGDANSPSAKILENVVYLPSAQNQVFDYAPIAVSLLP